MKNVQQGAKNLAKMLGWLLVWSVIGYLLLVAVCLLLAFFRRTVMRVRLLNTLPYMLVAATPFVWYKLTENHSCIHSFFTHRDLAVTIFATACILVDLSRKESTL